ncbi:kinase domain-containing protein [Nemania abortiva]|nr:kinase domain-containing protein [Nemania abortiva]
MSNTSERTVSPNASKQSSIKSADPPSRPPSVKVQAQVPAQAQPQNGKAQPINGAVASEGQPKPAEKQSIKTRLTRMFSNKDDVPKTGAGMDFSQPSKRVVPSPAPPASATSAPIKSTIPSRSSSTDVAPTPKSAQLYQRYVANASVPGGHEHHLKASRRQEKLTDMFKSFLGRKQEVPEADLSLVSSWVDTLQEEKDSLANDKRGGPNQSATLVEKYGKCQEVVGRGAFGIVRISHKKVDNGEKLFAVKEFRRRPDESEKKYSKRLTAEFCISSSLRHPNVIHTLDLLKDQKGDYCEVMEYCSGGDLYTLILTAEKLEVTEADCYFKQMMRGVEYMHEMGVAHRDLKPENLLLTCHGALKITDFGNGECFRMAWENSAHMVSGLCGSAPYIAPEEYIDKEFDARAVDVWACGVIYMAMRTGRHLWRVAKKDEDEFYERYLEGRRDEEGYGPIESLHRARCRNVIYSILDPNPSRRITASQVLKSEWGREIKLCKAGEEGL